MFLQQKHPKQINLFH